MIRMRSRWRDRLAPKVPCKVLRSYGEPGPMRLLSVRVTANRGYFRRGEKLEVDEAYCTARARRRSLQQRP